MPKLASTMRPIFARIEVAHLGPKNRRQKQATESRLGCPKTGDVNRVPPFSIHFRRVPDFGRQFWAPKPGGQNCRPKSETLPWGPKLPQKPGSGSHKQDSQEFCTDFMLVNFHDDKYYTNSGMHFIVESIHMCVVFSRYTVCAGCACICSSQSCDA